MRCSCATHRLSPSHHRFFSKGHNYFSTISCKNISTLIILRFPRPQLQRRQCYRSCKLWDYSLTHHLSIPLSFPCFSLLLQEENMKNYSEVMTPKPEDQLHSYLTKPCLGEEVGRKGRLLKWDGKRFHHLIRGFFYSNKIPQELNWIWLPWSRDSHRKKKNYSILKHLLEEQGQPNKWHCTTSRLY